MFDIKFFQNVAPLKTRIVGGEFSKKDESFIYDSFEEIRSPNPTVFNVETTNYCNMRCVMCPRTTLMTRKNIWIDDDAFEKVIDQITPHSPKTVESFMDFVGDEYGVDKASRNENAFYFTVSSQCLTLHGFGEPLIDKNIVKRITACAKRGIPTYFSCVPANIDIDKIESLMSIGLSVIKFSIDSLEDDEQRRIRGKRNDFTQSYQKILQVLDRKSKKNYSTNVIVTMIALAEGLDSKKMHEDFLSVWKDKDVFAYVKSQDNRWYHEEDDELVNKSHYSDQYCEFPWTSCTVMANGKVVPCTQDYDTEMVLGDVTESSLKDIWNSIEYKALRRHHITGKFPKGHKCSERCDLKKLHNYISES